MTDRQFYPFLFRSKQLELEKKTTKKKTKRKKMTLAIFFLKERCSQFTVGGRNKREDIRDEW